MHIAPPRWFWPIGLALAGGCGPDLPELALSDVTPSWGFNGEETTLIVHGDGLFPSIASPPGGEKPRIDAQFAVRLESEADAVPLEGVELRDYGELAARVPAGVEPGRYDLRVTSPTGATDLLKMAFLVTSSRADHLELSVESRIYTVNDVAEVEVLLLDTNGEMVADDLPVVVSFESDLGGEGLVVDATGLLNASIDVETHAITGRLSGEGRGSFSFTSTVPDNVTVTVSPGDNDSVVRDASQFLPFTTGTAQEVRVTLPAEDFSVTAGEPFDVDLALVDEWGNVLTDRTASVFLRETCGGAGGMPTDAVNLVGGQATVTVSLQRATSDSPSSSCGANGVEVYGDERGLSADVRVLPAAVESLAVLLGESGGEVTITAGEPELSIVVRAEDPFGNAVPDYATDIHFTDSANGLDNRVEGLGSAACFPWIDGLLPCVLSLDVAAEDVVVYARADNGVAGESAAFAVRAGPIAGLDMSLPVGPLIAGEFFEITVQAVDRLGNIVDADLSGQGVLEISDDLGGTSCTFAATLGPGLHSFGCLSTVAAAAVRYTAVMAGPGVSGAAGPIEVLNGALAGIELSLPAAVTAGQSFTLTGVASDAWGNRYTQGDPTLSLVDSSGSLVPSAATIDSAGNLSATVSITGAGDAIQVWAVRGATIYGSATLRVDPGPLDHFGVEPARIWVWQGDPLNVDVRALDAYDNVVTSYSGTATLSSNQALFLARDLAITDGVSVVALTWDAPGLADRVEVNEGATSGASVAIDALDPGCAEPPVAVLLVDGAEELSACLSGGSASATADFSQSSLGGAGLSHFLFSDGTGGASRTGSSSVALSYVDPGLYRPELLVVDTNACAGFAEALVWVNDKGAPAGELSVSLSHSTRTAGGLAADSDATVTVSAYDCAGDRAAGATLCARTDLGELSAGLNATGAGLCLTLDSAGQGSLTWSAQNLAYDGAAIVTLGVPSGAAYAADEISVVGDNHRPEVASWSPGGRTLEVVSELRVAFTEPLANLNYDSRVSLTGPSGAVSVSTALDNGGQELVITPRSAVDGAAGAWSLTLSSLLRDDSGNRLSGDWSGGVSGFTLAFGDVSDLGIALSGCAPSAERIVPDGDNGAGEEADEVTLALVASGAPSWWRLEVYDDLGALVRTRHVAGSATALTWDARADDGSIVPSGPWDLAVYAIDGEFNVSEPCWASVEVLQRYGPP